MSEARYTKLLTRIRSKIGDTGVPPAFSDVELKADIDAAIIKHNADYDIDSLPTQEEGLIITLVWMGVCLVLANSNAKEYQLSLDGMSIDKSKRVNSYIELYKILETEYTEGCESLGLITGSGDIVIGELVRDSLDTDRKVPYNVDRGLAAPFLQEPTIDAGVVTLNWSGVFSSDFLCYEVKRDGIVVASFYDTHTVTHKDTPAAGLHKYSVTVKTKNWISNESNVQEITKQ